MMFLKRVVLFIFLILLSLKGKATTSSPDPDSITVYVFLLEDCVISKNFTPLLNKLALEYKGKKVGFIGLFPNSMSRDSTIKAFAKKYSITFPLKTDHYQQLTRKMGVTITPEVAVFDHKKDVLLYRGRVNNQYERVGKRRSNPSTSELEDVIKAWVSGNPLPYFETKAVGCFINLNKTITNE